MNPKVNYTLVGLFVLLFGTVFIAWVFWLGFGIDKKNYTTYIAYMYQSVSGLNKNAAVKFRGVEVGKVNSIAIDTENPERIKLEMEIEEGTPVKVDTVAVLSTLGITGLAYIELSGGSQEAPLLIKQSESKPPEIITGPSLFVRLDTALTDLFVEFKTIASEISGVSAAVKSLLNEENQQAISGSLHNLEGITSSLNTHLNKIGKHVALSEEILRNTAETSNQLPTMISEVSNSMREVQEIIATVGKTAKTLDNAVATTQQEVSRSAKDSMRHFSQLFSELQRTTQGLNRILQEIERNPNMVIFGRPNERRGPGEKQ